MQKITPTITAAGIFLLLLYCTPSGGIIVAAECDYLKSNIKKERDLIKRRALFRQAVEVCPGDAGLHYSFAYGLERSRKYDEALEQYSLALTLDPTLAQAYFNRGDIYQSRENYAEAILAYQQGLLIDPENSRARKNLAKALGAAQNR